MIKQLRIGLDIDSTLLNTMKEYMRIYNTKYEQNRKIEELTVFDFKGILNLTKKEMYEIFDEVDYGRAELMDEHIPRVTLELSSKGYQIDLITASSMKTVPAKIERLTELGVVFNDYIVVDVHSGNKGVYAKEYALIIDDSPSQLEAILKYGGTPVCYDRPWNQEWQGPRINNFGELKRII